MEKSQEEKDIFFMEEALKEAKKAFDRDEVPIGAVIVFKDKVIARGHNQVELLKDATAHAEMICLTSASEYLNDWRLNEATIYCTVEPCLMCAGAILAARVKRIVWGTEDIRLGANGSWIDVFSMKHPMHQVEITKNILKNESAALLKDFFQTKRKTKTSSS